MSKPKVGVFGMTGCGGCQLELLNFEDLLLDLVGADLLAALPGDQILKAQDMSRPVPHQ